MKKTVNLNSLNEFLQKKGKDPVTKWGAGVDNGIYNASYYADGLKFEVEIPEILDAPIGFNKSAARRLVEKQIYDYLLIRYEWETNLFFGKEPVFEDFSQSPQKEKTYLQLLQRIAGKNAGKPI